MGQDAGLFNHDIYPTCQLTANCDIKIDAVELDHRNSTEAIMNTTESKESQPVEHIDEKGPGPRLDDVKVLNEEAAQATEAEHNMTLMQGLRTHKRAAMWSICR